MWHWLPIGLLLFALVFFAGVIYGYSRACGEQVYDEDDGDDI